MKPGGGRQKGASFERWVAAELESELGVKFRRELDQYQQKGLGDLRAIDCPEFPFTLELKRYARGCVARAEWWEQVCEAARIANRMPALIYKFDRQGIRCRVPFTAIIAAGNGDGEYHWSYAVDIDFQTFCMLVRELL